MIDRLKEYVEKDEIYQEYKNGKLTNASDFDKFCIQHCEDIEELLEENEELKSQLKGTTHCYDEVEHRQLKEQLEATKKVAEENLKKWVIMKNQQQEFIKYLEDEKFLYKINTQGYSMNLIENVLAKYKEIIGETND